MVKYYRPKSSRKEMNEDEKEIYNNGTGFGFILGIIFIIMLWAITQFKIVVVPI